MQKRVLVILGHPVTSSLCGALATSYAEAAEKAGHEVRRINLAELTFDPLLRHGYAEPQELEPDLRNAQAQIKWAQHVVFVYPTWWGSMPALMKGFIDRTFLPGFAFKYHKRSPLWDRLLTGRTAELIVTMDTPPLFNKLVNGSPGDKQMKRSVLQFTGLKPTRATSFGKVRGSSGAKRAKWIAKAAKLGSEI
jgi:putative NADPH-quinone reductase